MKQSIFHSKTVFVLAFLLLSLCSATMVDSTIDRYKLYKKTANEIRTKYERKAYKLKPSKAGHMAMRLWRNYEDSRYKYLLLQGIQASSTALDKMIIHGIDKPALDCYVQESNQRYPANTPKKKLRKETFADFPNYRLMSTKILRHLTRLDELGLRHQHHDQFMHLMRQYDYRSVIMDASMIKAWGAQLANQVYWLNQLGIADYRLAFMQSVNLVYPDEDDAALSKQQFENKIYTLTHIIIAASEYYRHPVDSVEYGDIINYFRNHVHEIITRCKEDVIIEVGLSLLLSNPNYPEIDIIRSYILSKYDEKYNMILSEKGRADFAQGEHRNIIAVLLLDWGGCSESPNIDDIRRLKHALAISLRLKTNES